jgi:hypothetical protein
MLQRAHADTRSLGGAAKTADANNSQWPLIKEEAMKANRISLICLLVILFGIILMPSRTAPGMDQRPVTMVPPPPGVDDKVPVANRFFQFRDPASATELLTLGSVWEVTECCGWTGTWKRRAGTNVFDCTWRHTNGTVVNDTVNLYSWDKASNKVILGRTYNNGSYWGTLNQANGTISGGGASWYPAGTTWSATFFATPQDPKGPVNVQIRR